MQVRPGGASEAAGIRVGHVVTTLERRDVTVLTSLGPSRLIGRNEIGIELQVTVQRGGKAATLKVRVEKPWWE